jgi:hypothetical protein
MCVDLIMTAADLTYIYAKAVQDSTISTLVIAVQA